MKRRLTIPLVIALTGCPGYQDRIPVTETANISIVQGNVCVTILPHSYEQLEAISIYRLDQPDQRTTTFFRPARTLRPEDCLPLNGYVFAENVAYHFSVKLLSSQQELAGQWPFSRELAAEFVLQSQQGQQDIQLRNMFVK